MDITTRLTNAGASRNERKKKSKTLVVPREVTLPGLEVLPGKKVDPGVSRDMHRSGVISD
jgi:hypothetical protein